MKPNMPRSWWSLPKSERDALQKAMTEKVYECLDEEEKEMLVTWTKLLCIIDHQLFGHGEERQLRKIVAWKRMYRRQARFGDDKKARDAWLDSEMKKIFRKNGFPDLRIQEMKDM
jgi:hypothetical protein